MPPRFARGPTDAPMRKLSTAVPGGAMSVTPSRLEMATPAGVVLSVLDFSGAEACRRQCVALAKSRSVSLPETAECCCKGTLSAPAAELPLTQRIPFGSTAWRISMNRRQVVESTNAALKGSFVDCARGFFRVFGRVKISVLLGFTVAAYNLDRIRRFRANQARTSHLPRGRSRRGGRNLGQMKERYAKPPSRASRRAARLSTASNAGIPCGAILARLGNGTFGSPTPFKPVRKAENDSPHTPLERQNPRRGSSRGVL